MFGLIRFIGLFGGLCRLPGFRSSLRLFGADRIRFVVSSCFSGSDSCSASGVVSTSLLSFPAGASDSGEL